MDEILEIFEGLRNITDVSISNVIAAISVFISGIAVLTSIISNNQTSKRYFDSLKPLLSFHLAEVNSVLILTVSNLGQTEANDIKMEFCNIEGNGENTEFKLSEIYKKKFTLYPQEVIHGRIAFSGNSISTEIAPLLHLKISYRSGNSKKIISYDRQVCFSEENVVKDKNERVLKEISSRLNEISYSNNRLTNYIEGRCLFKYDEINVIPKGSLAEDMNKAFCSRNDANSNEKQMKSFKKDTKPILEKIKKIVERLNV